MYAVVGDYLLRPLGPSGSRRAPPRTLALTATILALPVSLLAVFAGFAAFGDRTPVRPSVTVEIAPLPPLPTTALAPKPALPEADTVASESSSGVVVRALAADPTRPLIVTLPDLPEDRLAAAALPSGTGAPAHRLFAQPVGRLPGGAAPRGRIALVLGGIGLSRTTTETALASLPAAITLGLAPYGQDLAVAADRARAAGHETVLQVPMEPAGQEGDPGPKSLRTGVEPAANIDRLRWSMSRFSGYVAVMNYLGGRFTADAEATRPVVAEIASRGLGLVDDGSSPRSTLLAGGPALPTARAEAAIDAVPTQDAIDRSLARLETLAQGRTAVAVASALPITIDRIAAWSRSLASRGILLVPITAAMADRPIGEAGAQR